MFKSRIIVIYFSATLALLMVTTSVGSSGGMVGLDYLYVQSDIQVMGNYDLGIGIATGTTGDINGDGVDDLILASQMLNDVAILFGKKTFPNVIAFSETVLPDLRITSTPNNFLIYPPLHVADLSGDGIGDLFIPHASGVNVYWGRNKWPAQINANSFPVDLRIIAEANVDLTHNAFSLVVTGDINHDGMLDLLFTHTAPPPLKEKTWEAQLQKVGWIFWGRKQWPAVIDLRKQEADVVIWAKQPPPRAGHIRQLALVDLNGDGHDDLVVGGWYYMTGAFAYREEGPWHTGWIIPGGSHVPPKIVLQGTDSGLPSQPSTTPDSPRPLRLAPLELEKVFGAGLATGDVTGDGIQDLVLPLFKQRGKNSREMPQRLCLLAGHTDFFARGGANVLSRCQLIFGSPGFDQANPFPSRPPVVGDFNGDGRDDVFLRLAYPEFVIKGLLGQSFSSAIIDVAVHTTVDFLMPNLKELFGPFASFMSMGDINGDGYDDLLIVEPLGGGKTKADMGPGTLHVVLGRDHAIQKSQETESR